MSLTASVSYIANLSPNSFRVADTSVYATPDTKANFSARTLTILTSDGSALTGYANPINFPIGGSNPDVLTISGLTNDLVLQITLTLTPIVNNGGVYVATTDVATERFLQQGLFNIQVQRLNNPNPASLSDQQYRVNSMDIIIEAQNAQTAALYSNLVGGQLALNRGQNIINNTTL